MYLKLTTQELADFAASLQIDFINDIKPRPDGISFSVESKIKTFPIMIVFKEFAFGKVLLLPTINNPKSLLNKLAIKILQTVIPKSHLTKGVKFKDGFLEINPAKVINNLLETEIDIIITDFSIQENKVEIWFEV